MINQNPSNPHIPMPESRIRPDNRPAELLDRITDGIFAMDNEWRFVYVNDPATTILGIRKEDYLGKTFFECFPGMENSVFAQTYRTAMETGIAGQAEDYFAPFDRWYAVHAYPSKTGISVFFRDVTLARQEDEERQVLSLIAREAHNAVLICGTDFHIRWVNNAFTRMTGYGWEEATGQHACTLLGHPDTDPAMTEHIYSTLGKGEPLRLEKPHKTKAGQLVWWDVYYKPVHNKEGIVTHFFAVASDITARRKAAEKQKRYEEKIREQSEIMVEVLEQMKDGFLTINNDGRILYWNQQAEQLTGVPRHKAVGNSIFDVFPYVRDTPFFAAYEQLLKDPAPIHREVKSPTNDRWVELHAYTASKGLSVFFRDITARKENELALERLSLVAEQTSNIVAITNSQQRILWVNEAFTRITGYSSEEAIGRFNGDIFDGPDTDPALIAFVQERFAKRQPFQIEVLNYKKDGSTYWADVTCQPVFNEQGELLHFFSIASDITEQKRLQQHLEAERRRRQQLLTNAVIKAQESERALVSQELHDNVNQVLTTVKLYTELCRDGIGDPKELMDKSLNLLQHSINEIRSLSKRLSAPSLGSIRLKDSVRELIEAVGATNKLEVNLDLRSIEDLEDVDQDVHLAIYRILQEQLTNILKHAAATWVWVTFCRSAAGLQVKICDNGRGFDPAEKRGGIGITNMTTRAESVQGSLQLESAPGKGCTLTIKVPLPLPGND
jgi:PAS domain S-box-containing protein